MVTEALAPLAAVEPEALRGKQLVTTPCWPWLPGRPRIRRDRRVLADARKVGADRMIATVDPDTQHAHKTRSRQQDGYKPHLANEP